MPEPVIGADIRMRDAVQRVVGTLPFTLNHRVPGMTHARALRSPYPHARIRHIDTTDAWQAPGVIAVVTGADLRDAPDVDPYFGIRRADQPALAIGKVRYHGEPVALVVAETDARAQAAVDLIDVDYEELDFVTDPVEALRPGAPAVHDNWPDNACGDWRMSRGDIDQGWAESDRIYEGVYTTAPASHVPMEPHVCVAQWEGGDLRLWTATQAPHDVRKGLAKMFSLTGEQVRVQTFNLGGAYGAKGQVRIEPMVACAARFAGRPVRMELARDEVFFTIGRHGAHVRIRTGVKVDGRIVTREVHVVYNAGAYAVTSPGAAGQGLIRAPGPYRIPNALIRSEARYTNTVPTGPFRGAMTSQVCFAYESQLDEIAADLAIDPLELRRKNLLRDGDEYVTGEVMHDLHFAELADGVAEAIGWGQPREPTPVGKARGKGLAVMIKSTVTPSRSEAKLELQGDGTVMVRSSSVEMGQGSHTTMLQLVADDLGVPVEAVEIPFPDTAVTPFDTTTSSSRTTFSMGSALRDAASNLRQALARVAAVQWGCPVEEVAVAGGTVRRSSDPDTAKSYAEVLKDAGLESLAAEGMFQSEGGLSQMDPQNVHGRATVHWHQGAAAAEVEVDLETGRVEVLHCHGACYAGLVVSPFRVQQQNEGCVIFGLGPALFEEVGYDNGQLINPNLSDYMIPSILDIPRRLTSHALESPDPGADMHGVGEMAVPAVAPAIANAIYDATGVWLRAVPLTPERVLRAMNPDDATSG
ncbi:MAG: xanthine dehydrogenase family protein molybdopterin-binding subunit [Egibacteraceae bacterium]